MSLVLDELEYRIAAQTPRGPERETVVRVASWLPWKGVVYEPRAHCPNHRLVIAGCQLITRQTKHEDLGGNYFHECYHETVKPRAVTRLEKLWYQVHLAPDASPTG
jgi:hypothetical protein